MSEQPTIRELWPEPPKNQAERFEHFMDQWRDVADDHVILFATIGVYEQPTGILMGDLRALYQRARLDVDAVVYGSAAERLRQRLRQDIERNGRPPGQPGTPSEGQ